MKRKAILLIFFITLLIGSCEALAGNEITVLIPVKREADGLSRRTFEYVLGYEEDPRQIVNVGRLQLQEGGEGYLSLTYISSGKYSLTVYQDNSQQSDWEYLDNRVYNVDVYILASDEGFESNVVLYENGSDLKKDVAWFFNDLETPSGSVHGDIRETEEPETEKKKKRKKPSKKQEQEIALDDDKSSRNVEVSFETLGPQKNVKTGDETPFEYYLIVLLSSIGVILITLILLRRKSKG